MRMHISLLLYCHHRWFICAATVAVLDASSVDGAAAAEKARVCVVSNTF
jgi:hypothetical protein